MASDISNIVKSEIFSTLENLLSVTSSVEEVVKVGDDELDGAQSIQVSVEFEFSGKKSQATFFITTPAATQFEYLMLGGATDLKDKIDDDIVDAVKEIVSTICGSISTSVNAQGFPDISGLKFTLGESSVVALDKVPESASLYKFIVKLNDINVELFIAFDDVMNNFVKVFSGEADNTPVVSSNDDGVRSSSMINSLLGEESADNLKLLFDIKMRLSVRLGTKICLLRDVISWDIGEIIELSQMTSEPLDILVNGVVIGTGEAIIVDGRFGVKIKHIGKLK